MYKFKAGDLVRSPISKEPGIIIGIKNAAPKGEDPQLLCRVYWSKRMKATVTRELWLIPYGTKWEEMG